VRERSLSQRERERIKVENGRGKQRERKFFLLSFLSFSLCFLQIKEALKIHHRVAQKKVWL